MKVKALPDQERLHTLLEYNEKNGNLIWKTRSDCEFASPAAAKRWNTLYAGKEACSTVSSAGYKIGKIDKTVYYAHRVIWKHVYGTDPDQVDHISGNKLDNSLVNLRSVSASTNSQNKKLSNRNQTGHLGIFWLENRQRYVAHIHVKNKPTLIGYFQHMDDAIKARKEAELIHGYHPNHGRAA
jgi:hypothetical protein